MGLDLWDIKSVGVEKEKQFSLIFRDPSLLPGEKGWQETTAPMSEAQLRDTLRKLKIPDAKVEEEIAKAQTKS